MRKTKISTFLIFLIFFGSEQNKNAACLLTKKTNSLKQILNNFSYCSNHKFKLPILNLNITISFYKKLFILPSHRSVITFEAINQH